MIIPSQSQCHPYHNATFPEQSTIQKPPSIRIASRLSSLFPHLLQQNNGAHIRLRALTARSPYLYAPPILSSHLSSPDSSLPTSALTDTPRCTQTTALALTLTSIALPTWLTWTPPPPPSTAASPASQQQPLHYTYGLHSHCSSLPTASLSSSSSSYAHVHAHPAAALRCTPFPRARDCRGAAAASLCAQWRTAGFAQSLAVVLELAGAVAAAVVLAGGRQRRVRGWRVVLPLVAAAAAAGAVGAGVVAGALRRDERFEMHGWSVGMGWVCAVLAVGVQVLVVGGVGFGVAYAGEEGGYELVPEGERPRM